MRLYSRLPQTLVAVSAIAVVCSSVGCATLPWRQKQMVQDAEREAYLNQSVADIQHDQPSAPSGVEPASPRSLARFTPSSGSSAIASSGSGCRDGCCP